MPGVYIYDIMRYRNFFLLESWKNYTVSNNPEVLLYDFYLLSYLTTLSLSPDQKGFTGTLIGRDASEIRMDISKAENTLLPVLRKQLSDALFIAVCAEIRHILDRSQNWEKYRGNVLLKSYIQNYGMSTSHKIPREMKPRGEKPPMITQQVDYRKSYSAVMKALKDTGSTPEQFVRLCADLFKNGRWDSSYGGPKWAEIAEAWILLNKSPQTNQQLQVAIDHAYDLQHNTGTVLNKVVNYYINGDITWLKKALDHKADLKNIRELMIRASSDMRKLALEAFKTAGKMSSKKTEEYLQDKVPGYTTKQQPSSNQTSNTENNDEISVDNPPKVGDMVKMYYVGAKDQSQPYYIAQVIELTNDEDYVVEVKVKFKGGYNVGDKIQIYYGHNSTYKVIKLDNKTSSQVTPNVNVEKRRKDNLIGKKIVWNSPQTHIEATIEAKLYDTYKIRVTKIIKDEYGNHKVGEVSSLHADNIKNKYFSFVDGDTKTTTSVYPADFNTKITKISTLDSIDKIFIDELKQDSDYVKSTSNLTEYGKQRLATELAKPITNAIIITIGKAYLENNQIDLKKQSDLIRAPIEKLINMYNHIKFASERKKPIRKLKNLLIKRDLGDNYTNFVDKMIDSGKMNDLSEKYRVEFFEEYANVIHKLFSMVRPSIPAAPLYPHENVIDYKDIHKTE